MPELVSLLEAIREKGFEASLLTTYCAYLPFYEDVVLRRLLANGCRHNTVLMDAAQLAAALSDSRRPTSAGYDYTIVPMRSNAAFHPKLLLLVGPKRAVTCVGSHNLTLSGFGINREATSRILWDGTSDARGAQVARAAWRATQSWLDTRGSTVPAATRQNILAIEEIAPWLRMHPTEDRECQVLHQGPETRSLWQQVTALVNGSVKRIIVVGAFFDSRCGFIRQLESTYPKARLAIAIEPDTVQLTQAGAARTKGTWHDATEMVGRSGYLHAKLLYFETGGRGDVLCIGSANPSTPAWGIAGGERNEELIVAWMGSAARDFARQLGLPEIADLPRIGAKVFGEIDAANAQRKETAEQAGGICGIAVVEHDAIEIAAEVFPSSAKRLDLLDEQDRVLCRGVLVSNDGTTVRAPLPAEMADRARIVRITPSRGSPIMLLCHHIERRTAAAQSGRQAQLRQALASLEGDPTSLATLIAAVQKVVFAADVRTSAPGAPTSSGGRRPRSLTGAITSLEGDDRGGRHRGGRPRLAQGNLGHLLQVLIYELGKSLPTPGASADPAGHSEEEAVDADEETPSQPGAAYENDREVGEACGRRVRTLINRMVRVLDETNRCDGTALTTVAQLTAVLCTLRTLRQLDRQERWRQVGVSLVPEDCRRRLLDGILNFVVGGSRPLMRRAEVMDAEHSMEVGHLRGLMIWLAWECKFRADRKFSLGDEIEERDHNLLQRATLLELIVSAVPDSDSCTAAARSVESTASARLMLSAREWLQTHLTWGRRIRDKARIKQNVAPGATGSLARGSIVALTSGDGRTLHVVNNQEGGTVAVYDLTSEARERQFLRTKLVDIAPA